MKVSASTYRNALFCLALAGLICFVHSTSADAQTRRTGARTITQSAPAAPSTFSNTASITVSDRGVGATAPNGTVAGGPSTIVVSGLTGSLNSITVSLNGLTTARPRDLGIALVAPDGRSIMLMGDVGDLTGTTAINLTFSDSGTLMAYGEGTSISSGTYAPTDVFNHLPGNDTFPSPLGSLVAASAPTGTATLASQFHGINPNGTWKLYAIDDALGGGDTVISGGWSLTIDTDPSVAVTSTSVTTDKSPALTTDTVTLTSTTLSGTSPVTTGTVAFRRNGSVITGCGSVALNSSGEATCSTTLAESYSPVVAVYSGTANFGSSNGFVMQEVNSPTAVSGAQFCNQSGIAIPANGPGSPGPSHVITSGLYGSVNSLTVKLNGLTTSRSQDLNFLLISPGGGGAMQVASSAGNVSSVSGVDLTLSDSASNFLPIGAPLTSGSFKPTDASLVLLPYFDSYAPSSFGRPGPEGTVTLASAFGGVVSNGSWRLHTSSDGLGGSTSSVSGWCVELTLNKLTTSTTATPSASTITLGQSVTLTATVAELAPPSLQVDSALAPPAGSVEFYDGTTLLGTSTIASGSATLTTSSLTAGQHSITAKYLGSNVGPGGGGYAISTSSASTVEVLAPTAAGVTVQGRVLLANGRPLGDASVVMTDSATGARVSVKTNQFGNYRIEGATAGQTYIFTVSAKAARFAPQAITLQDNLSGLDFREQR